ncbi:dTDP-4-dehydrorhamnose reductase [Methanococcoides sp. AM1]|uniref:dTDP-4-dehydrorhamnose reductase n=1 Tax=Methanococcoides sp. AM1 TaxID=1201011 RepID=UPI00108351A2|nr:dTDP-4-dehydrorhamnose reductase [Methanococcoides sp. AM1]
MVVGTIKTVIIGASGMLGSDLCRVFPDAVKLTHKDFEITDKTKVIDSIKRLKADVVINAAAYSNVEGCEDNQDLAFEVNGHAPGYIAQACSDIGAILVHFSTDYVFDGSKEEYIESDTTNPINVYGQSKLMGEQKIIKNTENYRIIRTSWLFGKNGKNFVDTMLRLSKEMENVKVVNDQFGKPTYTADLASKTAEIINLGPGIYHITNEGRCTWYEFASEIINSTVQCSSEEFPTKAKRPTYSVLTNTKTTPMRHWKNALNEYLMENQ